MTAADSSFGSAVSPFACFLHNLARSDRADPRCLINVFEQKACPSRSCSDRFPEGNGGDVIGNRNS